MCFTDASVAGHVGPAAISAVFLEGLGHRSEFEALGVSHCSDNNSAELVAVASACFLFRTDEARHADELHVFSDSKFVEGVLSSRSHRRQWAFSRDALQWLLIQLVLLFQLGKRFVLIPLGAWPLRY